MGKKKRFSEETPRGTATRYTIIAPIKVLCLLGTFVVLRHSYSSETDRRGFFVVYVYKQQRANSANARRQNQAESANSSRQGLTLYSSTGHLIRKNVTGNSRSYFVPVCY